MTTSPLFLLIHGTWAPKAKWSYPKSLLGESLKKQFDGCQIQRISWSGANTFDARIDAAKKITQVCEHYSGPVFLIGHSHGGSAAIYSLIDSASVRKKVAGAVFMSTPFVAITLRSRIRDLYVGLTWAVAWVLAFFIGRIAGQYVSAQGMVSQYLQSPNAEIMVAMTHLATTVSMGIVLALFVLGVLASGCYLARNLVLVWINGYYERAKSLETTHSVNVPLLLLRSTGDEVALALGTLQTLSAISSKLSSLVARIISRLTQGKSDRANYFFLPFGGTLIASFIGMLSINSFSIWKYAFEYVSASHLEKLNLDVLVVIFFYVFVIMVLLGLIVGAFFIAVTILAWVVAALTLWAFGEFSPWRAFWLELAAEPLPTGQHTFIHVPWNDQLVSRSGDEVSLRHSEPYSNPDAINQAVHWIKAQLPSR